MSLAAATVLGIIVTASFAMGAVRSARIQDGTPVLGVVVRIDGARDATVRYVDHHGTTHHMKTKFPLGVWEQVGTGISTTVVYDRGSPDEAELPGHRRRHWQDAARVAGLTAAAAGCFIAALAVPRLGPLGAGSPARRWIALLLVPGLLVGGRLAIGAAQLLAPPAESGFTPLPPPLTLEPRPVQLPSALSDPPAPAGPLVTPAMAQSIFRALWPIRERALVQRDVVTLRAIEADPVLAVDVARLETGHAPNRWVLDEMVPSFRTVTPRQHRFPLRFYAEALTTSGDVPFLEMMVFVRETADTPWKLVLSTGTSANEHYTPEFHAALDDTEGFNLVPDAGVAPTDLVPALASYWQSWRNIGKPPKSGLPFASGTWTTDYGHQIADSQGRPGDNRLPSYSTYGKPATPPEQVWTFGFRGPVVLTCSPMYATVTVVGPVEQDEERRKWGPDVRPGRYDELRLHVVRQPCIAVVRGGQEIGVLGADRWIVRTTPT